MINAPLTVASAGGISFQTALWWGWVALAALGAGLALSWLYRRLFQLYPKRQAMTLLVLKLAAVLVLVLALLRPALYTEERDLSHAQVLLIVDDSKSMQTRDGAIGQPRIDDARRIAFENLLPKLKSRLPVTTLSFSDAVKAIDKPDQLAGNGEGSDIPNALLDGARNFARTGSVGAFVLVSDGGDARALPPAFSPGAPVFALAVGTDLSKSDDLRIGSVECPDRVDSKTDFEIKVEIAASGRREFFDTLASVPLKLIEGEREITAQNVSLNATTRKQNISLKVSAPEPGIHRYTLRLPLFKSEVAPLNNERTLTVEVQDPSLRVLYYASRLGQGYKPLRNALKSDPGIHFTGLVRVGADRFLLQGDKPNDNIHNEFPASLDILKKFKCVVLCDAEAKDLNPQALGALEKFVSEGGSLVVLGGPLGFGIGGWASTPLANAYPWQISASEPAYRSEGISVELTPMARAHPIFNGITEALAAGSRESKMSAYNSPGPLRPGAQALVLGALPSGERPAVVALSRYGKGKVLGIASHALWLWNDAEAEGGKAYSAFWRQAVRFLTGGDDNSGLLKLTADRNGRYPPGSKAIVNARVLDRSLAPLKGAALTGTLKKLDGSVIGAAAFREDGPAGSYSTDVELAAAGAYRLQVSASDDKGLLETREILLEAGSGTGEGAFPAVNTAYLQELSVRSGGAMLSQDQADELAEKVLAGVKAESRRREFSLIWDHPWYFVLFLSLMTAEWVARRRMNMI